MWQCRCAVRVGYDHHLVIVECVKIFLEFIRELLKRNPAAPHPEKLFNGKLNSQNRDLSLWETWKAV